MICNQQNSTEYHIIVRTCVCFSLFGVKLQFQIGFLLTFYLILVPEKTGVIRL